MRRYSPLVLALTLAACQTGAPLSSSKDNFQIKNVAATLSNTSKGASEGFKPELKSSTQSHLIRQSKGKRQLRGAALGQSTNAENSFDIAVSAEDQQRVHMVTLKAPAGQNLKGLRLEAHGKTLWRGDTEAQEVDSITLPIEAPSQGETYQLQLRDEQGKNAPVEVEVVSFIKAESIPRAVHSRIPDDAAIRKAAYRPGRIGIKFLEGMKVRLGEHNEPSTLKDETGLSLTTLQQFMRKHGVKTVTPALGGDPSEWDRDEAKAEALFDTDVANLNLFYFLEVDAKSDVWALIGELRKLPYVEEAYPEFIPQSSAPYTPSDPEFNTSKDQWLRATHIMQNRPSDPGPDDDGAWSYTQGGNNNVKVAVIDYGAQVAATGSHIPSTHEDLGNVEAIKNVNVSGTYTDLGHGTAATGVVGATANNTHGLSGGAFAAKTLSIHAFASGAPSLCLGTGFSGCDAGADAIILARKQGAKAIVIEAWFPPYTVEQSVPIVRAAIANTVAYGSSVFVPAGNNSNTDIRSLSSGQPMPDTGSVIVGGLKLDGSIRHTDGGILYNYGSSTAGGTNNLYTSGGHGVDVSAPAEGIYVPSFSSHSLTNTYGYFGGTSGATPIVGSIAALMLSVKADLSPLEIRKTLRTTRVNSNSDNSIMPGMVNAYAAVGKYAPGGSSSSTTGGLYGKFYASTIFPPEATLNSLANSASLQENFTPYFTKNFSTINHTGSPDVFSVGLNYNYIADIQGLITAPSTGSYTFYIYHDDTVNLKIDGQTIISTNRGDGSYGYSSGSINLNSGTHSIQILRAQERSNADTALWWSGPSISTQVIPSTALSHSTTIESTYSNSFKPNLIGRFFRVPSYSSPSHPLPIEPNDSDIFPYIGNKLYSQLNYTGGSTGDVFGIGYSDNFQGYFSGYIKLPSGYSSGTYTISIGHDDGMIFDFEGQRKINQPNQTGYVVHSTTHYLQTGIYYPFAIHYHENGGGADLRLMWRKPGSSSDETIPSNALFH